MTPNSQSENANPRRAQEGADLGQKPADSDAHESSRWKHQEGSWTYQSGCGGSPHWKLTWAPPAYRWPSKPFDHNPRWEIHFMWQSVCTNTHKCTDWKTSFINQHLPILHVIHPIFYSRLPDHFLFNAESQLTTLCCSKMLAQNGQVGSTKELSSKKKTTQMKTNLLGFCRRRWQVLEIRWWGLHNTVNGPNATGLYFEKWLKWSFWLCVFYYNTNNTFFLSLAQRV